MPFPYAFKYTLAVLYEPLSLYTMFYTMFSSNSDSKCESNAAFFFKVNIRGLCSWAQ